jgi:hypothetical protein
MKREEQVGSDQETQLDLAIFSGADNWELIKKILPQGWRGQAYEQGAIQRKGGVLEDPEILLRMLFIYLTSDSSYKETVCLAELGGLPHVSSVTLWRRLAKAANWFRWMIDELLKKYPVQSELDFLPRKIRLLDGSTVSKPGSRGTDWRLHTTLDIRTLAADFLMITDCKTGESFRHIQVAPGDVLVADRGYGNRRGVFSALKRKGDVIVRVAYQNFPLETASGKKFNYLKELENMDENEIKEWSLFIRDKLGNREKVRLCVYRRTEEDTKFKQEERIKKSRVIQQKVQEETIEAERYILVITTLDKEEISVEQILAIYRGRWQIELFFKRLKTLMNVGSLPSKNTESALSWITGKILIAVITQSLHALAEGKPGVTSKSDTVKETKKNDTEE